MRDAAPLRGAALSTSKGPIGKKEILDALGAEQKLVAKGIAYQVKSAAADGTVLTIALESLHGARSSAIDDSLEESFCRWGSDGEAFSGGGVVSFVVSDEGAVVVERWSGSWPQQGYHIRFFQQDFLQPLIDAWESPSGYRRAHEMWSRDGREPLDNLDNLPSAFEILRERQRDAVNTALFPVGLVDGPPGTGKTFTLGAMVSSFLVRFAERRVLLVGPTNVAVDTAICAVDDWLSRLGRKDLARQMKRLGSRFDVRRYSDRQHLHEPGVYEKALALAMMELEEPEKKAFEKYAIWKARLRELRKQLRNDVLTTASTSRVVAITTASALRFYSELSRVHWDLMIADEASQIPFPTALALGGLAPRSVFAGDPRQLAPVVQDQSATRVLEKTAFDVLGKRACRVFLNEQSRMCDHICECVSRLFYEHGLKVCRRDARNRQWRKDREPYFVQKKALPHVVLKGISTGAQWSRRYNGFIRFESANFICDLVDEMLGYTDYSDIVVLTPYRAQRALISEFLRNRNIKLDVSTVHRAQGSERRIVAFDPVGANSPFINSPSGTRLLNVAFSRAQAHLIVPLSPEDFHNPKMRELRAIVSRQQSNLTRFDLPAIIQ